MISIAFFSLFSLKKKKIKYDLPINVADTWSMPIVSTDPNEEIGIYSVLGGVQCVFDGSSLWDTQGVKYSRCSVTMRASNWWHST